VAHILVLMTLLCGLAVAAGWPQGYHSVVAYGVFWLLGTLTALSAFFIERTAFPAGSATDRVVRIAVMALSLIVLYGWLLGGLGWIGIASYVACGAACFLGVIWLVVRGGERERSAELAPHGRLVLAVLLPLLVLIATVGLAQWPSRYDSLNYHLYFPAQWLQAGRISIVPTPFGDEAPAYAPSNGELFFLWLMLPFHGDLLARIGQLPFYPLIGVTLYALARRAGAPRERAIYPAAFGLLARPIVEEAVGADVDLVFTSFFLSAWYLGVVAIESDRRNDWLVCGAAIGLCCGTKFLALVYVPAFLLLAFLRRPRPNALWILPGIGLLALPWYFRNWFVAGSPIYPSSLAIGGVTLARGAFTHRAMLDSIFHLSDFRLFGIVVAHAFGTTVFLFCLPFVVLGLARLLGRPANRLSRCLAVLPFAMVPLVWFGAPDNSDWRFIFPIVMVALVPLAFAFGRRPGWNRALHMLYGVGLFWPILGVNAQIPICLSPLPSYMRDMLSLRGLVASGYLLLFAGLVVLTFVADRWLRGGSWLRGALAFTAATAVLLVFSRTACPPDGCDFLDLTPSFIRSTMFDSWAWVRQNTRGETIAYTGNNVPYPLFGLRLANRVSYVNIDRHFDWALHDYDHARRRQETTEATGGQTLGEDLLARPSGVLEPARLGPVSTVDAVRPRFERMHGYRDAWLRNLKARTVTLLFISQLSFYEIDNVWHDERGFPIEETWARDDPNAFLPLFENPQVRVYAVRLR
jgi:hypothetical protein